MTAAGHEARGVGKRMALSDGCFVRTARKDWKCQARQARFDPTTLRATHELLTDHAPTCPVVIPRKSVYVEDVSEVAPYASGRRYSMACAEAFLATLPSPQRGGA